MDASAQIGHCRSTYSVTVTGAFGSPSTPLRSWTPSTTVLRGEGRVRGRVAVRSSSRRAPRRRSPRRRRRRRRRGCSGDDDGWTWRHPRPRGPRGGRGAASRSSRLVMWCSSVRCGLYRCCAWGTTRTAAEPGPATGGTCERAEERRGARPRGRVSSTVATSGGACSAEAARRRCGARRRAVRPRRRRNPAAAASRRRPARPCRARRRAVPARRSAAQRPAVATIQSELLPRARRPTMAATATM